jgi:hypothetical protein
MFQKFFSLLRVWFMPFVCTLCCCALASQLFVNSGWAGKVAGVICYGMIMMCIKCTLNPLQPAPSRKDGDTDLKLGQEFIVWAWHLHKRTSAMYLLVELPGKAPTSLKLSEHHDLSDITQIAVYGKAKLVTEKNGLFKLVVTQAELPDVVA